MSKNFNSKKDHDLRNRECLSPKVITIESPQSVEVIDDSIDDEYSSATKQQSPLPHDDLKNVALDDTNINESILEVFKNESSLLIKIKVDLSPPMDTGNFNDDVVIEPYFASPLVMAGKQRKGIFEGIQPDIPPLCHLREILKRRTPFDLDTPLPSDIIRSLDVLKNSGCNELRIFWASRKDEIHKLGDELKPTSELWYRKVPNNIARATGRVHIALLSSLMQSFGMKGKNWVSQFIFGFPIVGFLSQNKVFEESGARPEDLKDINDIFNQSSRRFQERSRISAKIESSAIWNEIIEQRDQGWVTGPFEFNDNGRLADDPGTPVNVAFRFPVVQPGKVRAVDDCRHSTLNEYTIINTPISLPSWDHVASCVRRVYSTGVDWNFAVADQWAAYKCEPLLPSHINYCILAVYWPEGKRYVAFKPLTQMFGSTAAVLNYNVLPRIIASLANRIFAIPVIGYVDDFGFIAPANICVDALHVFEDFCYTLGLSMKIEKSREGNTIVFLGIRGQFPSALNGFNLVLSLPEEKSIKWASAIRTILTEGMVQQSTLEKLTGKLGFAQIQVFARFARCMMQPLYKKLFSPIYTPKIHSAIIKALEWWLHVLHNIPERIVHLGPCRVDAFIYTDASCEPICEKGIDNPISYQTHSAILGAVIITPDRDRPLFDGAVDCVISNKVGEEIFSLFTDTSMIYALELVAVVLTLFQFKDVFKTKTIIFFIDNNAALCALIRGAAKHKVIDRYIATFWFIAAKYDIAIWLERVCSKSNLADFPSRETPLPIPSRSRSYLNCWREFDELSKTLF